MLLCGCLESQRLCGLCHPASHPSSFAAYQLQAAYEAKQEDDNALFAMRSELGIMAASRDVALQREDSAKELVSRLQDEIGRLRAQACDFILI